MTDAPRLTVIIPVWDRYASLLPGVVAHLLESQALQLKIIVVDNASDVVIPSMAGVDLLRSPRRLTTGAARNFALGAVDTELVAFSDADDELMPGALEVLAKRVVEEPRAVGAVASMSAYHPNRELVLPLPFPTEKAFANQNKRVKLGISTIVKNGVPVVGPAVWRTSAVRDAGGFSDLDYCEDWALAVALAFRGQVCVSLKPLMLVQFHTGSQVNRNGRPMRMLSALRKLHARWYRDPAIPLFAKLLMPALVLPRLRTISQRFLLHQVSHGDILAQLGNPELNVPNAQ